MTFKRLFMQTYSETSNIICENDDREELCKFLCNRFSAHYITRRQNFNKKILWSQNREHTHPVCRNKLWKLNFSILGLFGMNKKFCYNQKVPIECIHYSILHAFLLGTQNDITGKSFVYFIWGFIHLLCVLFLRKRVGRV